MLKWLIPTVVLIGALLIIDQAETCNEAVCGSVVSKCLLTKSCNCDLKNCTCCKDCFNCLSYLYSECCSCVDMCPKPNDTGSVLSKKVSYNRWNSIIFPVDIDISQFEPKKDYIKLQMQGAEQEVVPKPNVITINCTVAFWSQCMSWSKCKTSCLSMGSSSYRWFHDGCCECIGQNCINFGIDESRCSECPLKDEVLEELTEDDFDYGEDEDYSDNEMDPKMD
ncbi:hypothetical protein NQ318_006275 [Aromia moschata]|uniref:Protein twisted gastrulation n=1 Tax=Aromia moschata TaxID=1265417 RepID=A0AAV8YWQ6_9CUCU|nr:hypothetical protein NQ318_006275 [Aromia moschata]